MQDSFHIFDTMSKFLLLFLLLPFGLLAQEESDETDRIYWNDWYRLEWGDFEAEPAADKKVAALSSIGLPYTYTSDGEGEMTVQINVCFIRSESWSKEAQENNVLLQHEQLHFDIAEVHRRKIIKALTEADFTKHNYKEKLEEIIDRIWVKEYRIMQDKYDKETNFSRIFKEQIAWNNYVLQQLRNLEKFAYTELSVSLISFD